jgi:FkbM family methyltransferase
MHDDLRAAFSVLHSKLGSTQSALERMLLLKEELSAGLARSVLESKSQLGQDLFVLAGTNFKKNGFFVEFGATNGKDLSNTWLLEKCFHWNGILAEPARTWHTALRANRACWIETACVWKETGSTLTFNEAPEPELSTIESFSNNDHHDAARRGGRSYAVPTISLQDLLARYDAPNVIDYLSLDTEGSEFEILQAFDFDTYAFRTITCEHNFTANRNLIHALLTAKGYVRVFENLSRWDDWYAHPFL